MKIGFFIFFITSALFAQTSNLDTWTEIYNGEPSISGQMLILRMVAEQEETDSGPFFAGALSRLLREYPSLRRQNDFAAADECAMIIARELGRTKYAEAGPDIWKAVETFNNPLVKSELVISLGKAGAANYLPHVVQLLTDLNTKIPSDLEMQVRDSRIAYGAILSLENFKDISGYLPVFFAANGWYDFRVKAQAAVSLPAITDDPTDPLVQVLQSSYPYAIKYLALQSEEASQAPEISKAGIAVVALAEGWKAATIDIHQQNELAQLRKLSLGMIRRYGTPGDTTVYSNLGRSYREGIDTNEKLDAIQALAVIGTNEAALLLNSFILTIHQRRERNSFTPEDDQLIQALIIALGVTKQSIGKPSLVRVQQSPAWSSKVRNLARANVENLTIQPPAGDSANQRNGQARPETPQSEEAGS
jgi:hypothetical protein